MGVAALREQLGSAALHINFTGNLDASGGGMMRLEAVAWHARNLHSNTLPGSIMML